MIAKSFITFIFCLIICHNCVFGEKTSEYELIPNRYMSYLFRYYRIVPEIIDTVPQYIIHVNMILNNI